MIILRFMKAPGLAGLCDITMLDREPAAVAVSWMVPVCQALQSGGIQAAYTRDSDIKANQEYFFDSDELVTLVYQLIGVQILYN